MLNLARFHAALALVTFAAVATGCGDDESAPGGGGSTSSIGGSDTGAGGTGGTGGDGGAGGTGGDGGGGGPVACESTEGVTLALSELYFGEGNSGEWKSIGRNIDGLESDENSTDVCQPNSGGNPDVAYPDGDDGIDNSFGKNLLPVILSFAPNWVTTVNAYLDQGTFNTMMKMYCLPETGDAPQLTTKIFGGTDLGMEPQYDGTDEWPVAPEILSDPQDPESSTLVFENSSVTGDTFDSGENESFVLVVPIVFGEETVQIKLTLYNAQLTLTLSEDRRSATGGLISGVLNTEEVVDQMRKVAFAAEVCDDTSLYNAMIQLVRQASDIMADGSQDSDATCDGISFGVAFDMEEVLLGDVGPASPPGDSCPPPPP